ncbi:MAG TPA: preprotein translocase subunit SecE [Myxococcaceae bacterium]|nr:preprotein translocase subunit SecE [Myxococcaceae bacterium]
MARGPRNRGNGGPPRSTGTRPASGTTLAPAAAGAGLGGAARNVDPPKPRVTAGQFAREVRAEGRKITWPSRRETWITSVFVFVMVVIASVFFALVDGTLSFVLQQLLRWVNQ